MYISAGQTRLVQIQGEFYIAMVAFVVIKVIT